MENLKLPGAWREALFDTALVDFLPGFSVRPLSLMWMASHLQNLGGIRVAFPERGFPPTWPLWPKTLGHLQAADGLVWGSESTSPPRGHIWVRSFLLPCWALPLAGPCVSLHGSFELEMRQLVCGLWLDRQQAGWISASTGPSSEGPWATYEGNGSLKRKTDAPDSRRLVVDYQLLRYYPLRVLCLDGRGFAREGQPLASSLFTREGPRICRVQFDSFWRAAWGSQPDAQITRAFSCGFQGCSCCWHKDHCCPAFHGPGRSPSTPGFCSGAISQHSRSRTLPGTQLPRWSPSPSPWLSDLFAVGFLGH